MSDKRFPESSRITVEDFVACGWKEILSTGSCEGYLFMSREFSSAAAKAMEENRCAHGKVLWLLADACSMLLFPDSTNEPFRPMIVMKGYRSAIPDDMSDDDILFFSRIVDQIDNSWLKARLADLVWLRNRALGIRFALIAIDSYRSIEPNIYYWLSGGCECWKRAITLALMLKKGAEDRLIEMEAALVTRFETATLEEGSLSLQLSDLLMKYRLGRKKPNQIAQKLESLAQEFNTAGALHQAREHYRASKNWFDISGNNSKSTEMTIRVAESWVREAIARTLAAQPSHAVAASFYEKAIQVYRTVPHSERSLYRVDERIDKLRECLTESGEKSLEEMSIISTNGVDITQIIEQARDSVKNRPLHDALKAFANLHPGVSVKKLQDDAVKRLQDYPLQALLPATFVGRDGRVISKHQGISPPGNCSDNRDIIRSQTIRDYLMLIDIVVQGRILPALEVLNMEHRLRECDFVDVALQSPIVPIGRESLFGKALFAGYDRDFVVSIHLLVPQIEHMARSHLKAAGAKTTNLDINGIENENGLSSLMDLPEAVNVFGEDLTFEIRALFCDAFGPNLRNELAHGLVTEEACCTTHTVYAWWLALKLVSNAFWNAPYKE